MARTDESVQAETSLLPDNVLAARVREAGNRETVIRLSGALPDVQLALSDLGVDAVRQGQRIAGLVDAITRSLIEIAEADLGPAPGPYAWLACGSQGRGEQTVHTDQDHALIHADGLPHKADTWFESLAVQVGDDLAACGISHCPGGVAPRHADWRGSVTGWRQRLLTIIASVDTRSVMLASHYFDLRVLHGDACLFDPVREGVLAQVRGQRAFLGLVARNASRSGSPFAWMDRLRLAGLAGRKGMIDLKRACLLPISQFALSLALHGGLAQRHTLDRLAAAEAAGLVGRDAVGDLTLAYRTVAGLRLLRLVEAIRAGERPDNRLPVDALPPLGRQFLRGSLSTVGRTRRLLRLETGA